MTGAGYVVMLSRILHSICNIDVATNVLDTEGCIMCWKIRVGEGARQMGTGEIRVVGFYLSAMEIGGIDECARTIATNSKPFVDGTRSRIVYREDGIGKANRR